MAEFKVGQTIETTDGRTGVIRFIGEIHVAAGQFLGIELPDPSGKNDGSVQGERYFSCPPAHGLFLRAAGITQIISQPAPPKAVPPKAAPPKAAPRQSLAARAGAPAKPRPSSVSLAKAPPKPAAPQKRLSTVSSTTLRDPFNPPKPASGRKSSISSSSTVSASARPGSTSSPAPNRLSRPLLRSAPSSSASTAPSKATTRDPNVDTLETKIRHLEKQLAEDRETIKMLDQMKGDKARIESILQKVQAKCQTFHQENTELKARVQEIEAENERLDRIDQEHETILEIAELDREFAVEKQELAESELEQARNRLEELELELDILKGERDLLTEDMTDEDKHTTGYFQLQTERDRLRHALMRLKDMTEETEADLQARIRELENDQAQIDELREKIKTLEETIATSEKNNQHLREQLDAAEDAEEIINDLSTEKQHYQDQLAEKEMVIKDLENLKELNDELEMHHMEQANELRAELDIREAELADQTRKLTEQEAAINDQDSMINKFRDLVMDLQAKMTDAESSKNMSEEQAKDVSGRFNEMMEMNRNLRNATLTSTVKTIMSELQKLHAEEAEEELEIIKHYLPDSPNIYRNDSLRAYFRAKRVSFKSSLTSSLMKSLSLQSGATKDPEQPLHDLMRLDAIHQLTYLHLKSGQFRSAVGSSTLEQFVAFAQVFEELAPVEKTLERCLDSLKNDELNFKDISDSLRRSNQILRGVTVDYKEALATRPEDEIIFRVSSIKSNLELIKSTFDTLQSVVRAMGITEGDWDSVTDVMDRLSKPSESSGQSIVATVKLIRTLETLRNDSLYPSFPSGVEDIAQQDDFLGRMAQAAQKFATELTRFLLEQQEEESEDLASGVSKRVALLQDRFFANNELVSLAEFVTQLKEWNEFAAVLKNNVEIEHGPAPWVIKAKQIEAAKKQTAEAEKELQSLKSEHKSTVLLIREREETIDTKDLEIEHLRAKHKEAVTKIEDQVRLQKELQEAEADRSRLQQQLKAQQVELLKQKERALSERSEPIETRPITPSGTTNPAADKPAPTQQVSSSFVTFVEALSNENHWLRQRGNHEMFGHNLKAMFTKIRDSQVALAKRDARRKQEKADEMLAMCLNLERAEFTEPTKSVKAKNEFSDFDFGSDIKSASLIFNIPTRSNRRSLAPIMLTGLKTPMSWSHADIEDLSFDDLSPVAEEFDMEIDTLEGYSEVGEAFSS